MAGAFPNRRNLSDHMSCYKPYSTLAFVPKIWFFYFWSIAKLWLTFVFQLHLLLLVGLPPLSGNAVVWSGYLLLNPLLKERLVPSGLMNRANLFFPVSAVPPGPSSPSPGCCSPSTVSVFWQRLTVLFTPLNIKVLALCVIPKGLSQGRGKNVLFPLLQVTVISLQITFFMLLLVLYTNCNLKVLPSTFPTQNS